MLPLLLVTAASVLWFWSPASLFGSENRIEQARVVDLGTTEAPVGRPSESRATTASATGDVPTVAPRRPHGIRISGEMAGAMSFRLMLPGAAGAAKLHQVAADGSFEVATVPTTRCELVAFLANGAMHRRSFDRAAQLAADDWQLGAIDFTPIECEVGLHVRCSPEVVTALLDCGRRQLVVALRAEAARGEVLGEFRFDLAAVPAGASSIEGLLRVRVAEASPRLSVRWTLVGDVAIRVPFALGSTDYLGGNRHLARLELLPETVVRGRVLWPDGGSAIGQLLECGFALVGVLERFPWVRIHTEGEIFTFLVPPAWLVAAQDVHDLRLAEALPNGGVVVERGRAPLAPGSQLHLTGCGPIAGLRIVSTAASDGLWRIDRVPVGTYEVTLEGLACARTWRTSSRFLWWAPRA